MFYLIPMKATSIDDQASNCYDQKQSFVSGKIKVMTIYHKLYNIVNTFYQNFTILSLSPVKVFYLTLKPIKTCR
jgi:hypothetical protein